MKVYLLVLLLLSGIIATMGSQLPVLAQESPTITVNLLADFPSTPWGDTIQAYGSVTNSAEGDSVTIEWGDGVTQPDIQLDTNSNWGLVDHIYGAESVGAREIVVRLIRAGEQVANGTLPIEVLKRSTFTAIDPINDVVQGQDITASGILYDAVLGVPLQNIALKFSGTGATDPTSGNSNLAVAITDENGIFSSTGPSRNVSEDGLVVEVTLVNGTNIYADPSGNTVTFDTISSSANSYSVQAGTDVPVDLPEFAASIEFEDVATGGDIIAYDCVAPQSPRYLDPIQIDVCFNIRPSLGSEFVMADASSANITLSVDGVTVPSGYSFSDLHMFRVDGNDSVADITLEASQAASQITGQTLSFSKFIIAIPDFPGQSENSLRVPITLGSNTLEFRNVNSLVNNSATFEIIPSTLTVGDSATLKITDPNGNVDPNSINTVTASLFSTTSTETGGITLNLQETGENTGIFTAVFTIISGPSSGNQLQAEEDDEIFIQYSQTAGRLKAIFEGITEAGIAEAIDYPLNPNEATFIPILGAVELQLVGAQLGPEGIVDITMSYANSVAPGQDPVAFRLYHLEGGVWQDITLPNGVNNITKTVSGQTTFLSPFCLGVDAGVPGGAGGGLARPGAGIVVDFVASIAAKPKPPSDEPADESGPSKSSSGGGSRTVVITNNPTTTYPESYFAENPLQRIQIKNVGFSSLGTNIFQAITKQPITIGSTFTNQQQQSQSYSFIVMIIDENGYTLAIDIQNGTLEAGKTAELTSPWITQDDGIYTFKIFVWNSITNTPIPLSELTVKKIRIDPS